MQEGNESRKGEGKRNKKKVGMWLCVVMVQLFFWLCLSSTPPPRRKRRDAMQRLE